MLKHLRAVWLAAALLSLSPAAGWGSFMLPPSGYRAKDFTVVKHDGLYHLFYIRRNVSAPAESTEVDFGHAVSSDLFSWAHLAPVVPVRPGHWDNRHVWAPHVVESDGVFYMFYTGVTHEPGVALDYQRIGYATSTDLFTWNRPEEPLFSCEDVPWAYCNPLSGNTAFRDPFVMRDPLIPGRWRLYYSTSLDGDSTAMVTGRADSPELPGAWWDMGPLWVTNESTTFSELSESSHLFEHEGLWHLMWTTNKLQPIVWATHTDPGAGQTGWTYRGTLESMLGFDTSPWFASEHLRDGLIDYFMAASNTAIEILRMQWTSPTTFQLLQPSTFHVRRMHWSKPVVAEGDTATLTLDATGWYGYAAEIEVLEIDAGGIETIVPNHQVGLPQQIPMNANPTVYTWTPKAIPDAADGEDGPEIVVRLKDRTAVAPVIRVAPRPVISMDGPHEDPGEGFILHFMRFSPVGSGFRLGLAAAADVRLEVFDVAGRLRRRVHAGPLAAGTHVLRFDPAREGFGPGVYFARLSTPAGPRTVRFAVTP